MAYFSTVPNLDKMLELFSREERWLIVINADPDAIASALALKRIMSRRVLEVRIAKINDITRPDNLAMIRYTHAHMVNYRPSMKNKYHKFAMVDSQPHHSPAFKGIPFSIIIDHHPYMEQPLQAPVPYQVIKPEYGATSTMLTEYLYKLKIRPGMLLATALQFGIKTDTASFERHFYDVDLRAYQYLAKFADHTLLTRISRNEFYKSWLDAIAKAINTMYPIGSSGQFVFAHAVENTDILVIIADFLTRVYEIRWVAVSGICHGTVVTIFRGDGIFVDVGKFAQGAFGGLGSAGGHKAMGRAEFPLKALEGKDAELFCLQRLSTALKERISIRRKEQRAATQTEKQPGETTPAS